MLTIFGRKKISEDKAANVFVNSILDVVETGYQDVAQLVNDDPSFVSRPGLDPSKYDKFLLIVITANLKFLTEHFEVEQEKRLKSLIIYKLSQVFDTNEQQLRELLNEYGTFMCRVNHPSKNTLYSMSKAFFHKYDLSAHQEEYFKNVNTPNPLFLKRLDDVMKNFIWDWPNFLDKYKLAS